MVGLCKLFGENHVIEEFTSLGEYLKDNTIPLVIGKNAIIRSHTVIYRGTEIGDNFQTGHGVLIREDNKIGNNVSIGSHTVIERKNDIRCNVRIHSNCFIPEFVQINENVWISPGVTILNVLHPPCPSFEKCAPGVVIESNVKIGGNVTICPRITIGKNAFIGAGSVVTKDVPKGSVVIGNPGKVVGKLQELKCKSGFQKFPYCWDVGKRWVIN